MGIDANRGMLCTGDLRSSEDQDGVSEEDGGRGRGSGGDDAGLPPGNKQRERLHGEWPGETGP